VVAHADSVAVRLLADRVGLTEQLDRQQTWDLCVAGRRLQRARYDNVLVATVGHAPSNADLSPGGPSGSFRDSPGGGLNLVGV